MWLFLTLKTQRREEKQKTIDDCGALPSIDPFFRFAHNAELTMIGFGRRLRGQFNVLILWRLRTACVVTTHVVTTCVLSAHGLTRLMLHGVPRKNDDGRLWLRTVMYLIRTRDLPTPSLFLWWVSGLAISIRLLSRGHNHQCSRNPGEDAKKNANGHANCVRAQS